MALAGGAGTLQRNTPAPSLRCQGLWKHPEDFPVPFPFSAGKFPLLEGKGCDLTTDRNKKKKEVWLLKTSWLSSPPGCDPTEGSLAGRQM